MINLEDAINLLKENLNKITKVVECDLINSLGKVIGEDVYAPINQPPFNRSPYDGYALKSKFCEKDLKVLKTIYAGDKFDNEIKDYECVKIMTGAKVPKDVDCVVKQEDVEVIEDRIKLKVKLKPSQNICFEGEDIKKGELIIKKGTNITYSEIGVLASLGINKVKVCERLKIGILSTGSEIIDIGQNLEEAKIFNSNLYSIGSKVKELGLDPVLIGCVDDEETEIINTIKSYIDYVDLILTTGGVSVGEKDLVPKVFENIGAKQLFWKIDIQPGTACVASVIDGKLLFGLSGNPSASLMTFDLIIKPIISYLENREDKIKRISATFKGELNKKAKRNRYFRGRLSSVDGELYVELTNRMHASGNISTTLSSNCIIEMEKGRDKLKNNDKVLVIIDCI